MIICDWCKNLQAKTLRVEGRIRTTPEITPLRSGLFNRELCRDCYDTVRKILGLLASSEEQR